jgi:uncharacterized cysteine cluster protein YcgN (CxxCxxCC family)
MEEVLAKFTVNIPPSRECGTCRACCEYLAIPDLGKPADVLCSYYDTEKCNCSIYEKRFDVCRNYQCFWLNHPHILTEDEQRPDRLGVIFTLRGDGTEGNELWLQIVLLSPEARYEKGAIEAAQRAIHAVETDPRPSRKTSVARHLDDPTPEDYVRTARLGLPAPLPDGG